MKIKCPKCKKLFKVEWIVEFKSKCPSLQAPDPYLTIKPDRCPYCKHEFDAERFWQKIYKGMVEGYREAILDEHVRASYGHL
jgi:uncharacterized Zn-finger protein